MSLSAALSKLRCVSIGHVTHDRYGDQLVPGGCAFFGAKAAQVLGARVQFLTRVGSDFQCDRDLEGMETVVIREGETTVFTNSYPEGGLRVQHVESQAGPLTLGHFPREWGGPDLLFNAPVMGEISTTEPWGVQVKPKFFSLSLQGFMKRGEKTEAQKRVVVKDPSPLPNALFEGVDAVFLSEEDLSLFGAPGLLKRMRELVPLVFVTLGDEGCRIFQGERELAAGVYKTTAEDPTGAGDTFAMSTSLALAAGRPPREAALFGAAAASIVVEGKGSLPLHRLTETYERYGTFNPSV